MNFKKGLILLLLITCLFISISAICAADDSNQLANDTGDVLNVAEEDNIEVADNEILSAGDGSFNDLQNEIAGKSEYRLERNYTFDDSTDGLIAEYGISIENNIVLDGQGHTIDAKGKSRIFDCEVYGDIDVTLKNIIFVNGYAEYGGAIFWYPDGGNTNIINCTFINNTAEGSYNGGAAIYESEGISNIINCTFINNRDPVSVLVLSSTNVVNSIFLENPDYFIYGSGVTADYNWFGATTDDYMTNSPKVSGVTINNYYVLNFTLNHEGGIAAIDLNNLYENGVLINDYDNYALPQITFKVKGDGIEVVDNVTLDDNGKATIAYTPAEAYSLTIGIGGFEFKREVKPTYNMLKDAIDNEQGDIFNLEKDYAYNPDKDNDLANGVEITKTITIDGHGHEIDAMGLKNIFYFNDESGLENLTLQNIIFTNSNGPAVYFKGNRIQIINCTFKDNGAANGDAIYIADAKSGENQITQSTFVNNIGTNSAVYINLDSTDAKFNIINSIFVNNTSSNNIEGNGNITADYNWWGNIADNYNQNISNVEGIVVDKWYFINITTDDINDIATLSLNNLYGGDTSGNDYALPSLTFKIVTNKVGISKGFVTLDENGEGSLRYQLRDFTGYLAVDYNKIRIIKQIDFVDNPSFKSLQELIRLTPENGEVNLTHDYGYADTDTITDGINIDKVITIKGNNHIIDAKGNTRIFYIASGGVILNDINIVNGHASSGAAIYKYYCGGIEINNCTFINNSASSSGGAIYGYYFPLGTVINSTFINNTAFSNGAAIYVYGGDCAGIDGCIFINNSAKSSVIYGTNSIKISNSIFIKNNASNMVYASNPIYNTIDINNNWWGNTFDNYIDEAPTVSSGISLSYLYLDITFYKDYAIVSLNKLYDPETGDVSDYVNYNLPNITLNINSTSLNLDTDNITLNSTGQAIIPYTFNSETGALTVSYNGVSLTKETQVGQFGLLQQLIDSYEVNSVIELNRDYTYIENMETTDEGIYITKNNLTIDGKGHTIDAKGKSGIFVLVGVPNITFKNINFINGNSVFEDGSAIYYYDASSVDFNVINCTFVNNTALADYNPVWEYGGGAIYLDAKDGNYNIQDSKFINNSAKCGGGAIYSGIEAVDNASLTIKNCSFIDNSATYGGAIMVFSLNVDYLIDFSTFVNNSVSDPNEGGAIYLDARSSQSIINNSIFVDNKGSTALLMPYSGVNFDNNWWGNTALNYNNLTGILLDMPNTWLFLNSSATSSEIYLTNTSTIRFFLQLYDNGVVSDYDKSRLPEFNLTLTSEKGTINKTVVALDEDIEYNATEIGDGKVAAQYGGISYEIPILNKGKSIISVSQNPIILYVKQTRILLKKIFELNHEGTLEYSINDSSIAEIQEYNGYRLAPMKSGTAILTVSYISDNKYYDSASVDVEVDVLKTQMEINVTNKDTGEAVPSEITLYTTEELEISIVISVDESHISYTGLDWNQLTYQLNDTWNASFSFSSQSTASGGSKNGTGTIRAIYPSTVELTIGYNPSYSSRFTWENVTIKVNILMMPTEITLQHDDNLSFIIGDHSKINATLNYTGDLSYESNDESIVSVNPTTGELVANSYGTAIITVKYAGNYQHAQCSKNVTVNVNKIPSSITLNTENPLTINVFNESQIDAVLNHAGNLSYASSNPVIVSVDENGKITAYAGGVVNITISYAGNDTYAKAEDVNLTVIVNKLQSHINVEENTISVDVDANDTIVASMEGRALRFVSNDPNVVSVNETTGVITGIAGGTANVTVIFDEDGQYLGDEVNVTVTVNKLKSSLTVENPEITIDVDASALIDVRTNSDGELEFISGNATIASLNANNVTGLAGGKVNVTVRVKESGRYLSNETNVTVTVNKLQSTISVESPSLTIAIDETIAIVVSSNNDDLSYTTDSPIISIEGNVVKGISNGTCVVTVAANENGRYLANSTTVTVAVNKISSAIAVNENATFAIGDVSNLNATLNHAGSLNYTSTNESVITVDENGNIKAIKEGEAQILITFNETDKYLPTSATVNVTVTKKDVPAETAVKINVPAAGKSPTLTISLPNATGKFSVTVDGKQYGPVSLVKGTASITVPELEYGEHSITVTYSGDDNYAPINYKTSVSIKKPVLSKNKNINMRYSATAKYTVRVTVNGKAIAGQYVTFKFNGKTKNIKTDKNGYATFKIPTVKPKKTAYGITATFKGVTVKNKVKVNSIINAKNLKVKKSKKVVKIVVSLKKVNGKYLKGKMLKLKIRGKTLKAKTNKKGKAVFKLKKNVLKKLKVGKTYTYKVIYGKDVVTKKVKVKR